jgi:hypothetical protein
LELRNPPLAAVLAWLVPGLGHFYQGRIGKGVLFAVCVFGLFFWGYRQGQWQVVYLRWDEEEWRWPYLAQLGTGTVALPALLVKPQWRKWLPQRWRELQAAPTTDEIDELHRIHGKKMDIAVIYTMLAGLLNLLAVYDAFAGPALWEEERRRHMQSVRQAAGEQPA